MLIEYDPTGNARDLDIDELDKDYNEHISRNNRNVRDDWGHRDDYYHFDN